MFCFIVCFSFCQKKLSLYHKNLLKNIIIVCLYSLNITNVCKHACLQRQKTHITSETYLIKKGIFRFFFNFISFTQYLQNNIFVTYQIYTKNIGVGAQKVRFLVFKNKIFLHSFD